MFRSAMLLSCCGSLLVGCGSAPSSFDMGTPKPEYASAAKAVADAGGLVTCDKEGEVTFLDFHANRDVAAAVPHVKSFPQLKMLNFSSSALTDELLEHIAGATTVEELGLHGTQVTSAGLVHLKDFQQLRVLNLTDTQVDDAGLAELTGLSSLIRLDLQNTQVTDAGLTHLAQLPNLVYVVLSNSPVTEQGVEALRKQLPDAEISFEVIEDLSDEPMLRDDQLPD